MGSLRINKLVYKGDNYQYVSPDLSADIVIIEGPNGSGKSTFFDLLFYGLGGKVEQFSRSSKKKHEEIVFDKNNYVELSLDVNHENIILIRNIGQNKVLIIEPNGEKKYLPINRNVSDDYIFSDWLLAKLEVDVFSISQGSKVFKLGFNDLARLIYHNQNADPELIYKPADNSGYVSDSLYVRRAIFEVLVGKSLLDYYKKLSDLKAAENNCENAKSLYTEYSKLVDEINEGDEIKNIEFLNREILEKENRLIGLLQHRREVAKIVPSPVDSIDDINRLKNLKISQEFKLSNSENKRKSLMSELASVLKAKVSTEADIERVSKIIMTHEQLSLFSPDTCPYCLNDVNRPANKCVCGCNISEDVYQRFFYSAGYVRQVC